MSTLLLTPALPLLAAFLQRPAARISPVLGWVLGPAALAGALALLGAMLWQYQGIPLVAAFGGFAAPVGIVFYADQLALLMGVLVAAFGFLFWPWSGSGERVERDRASTLLLLAASIALALSGDLFNLFVFYELASIASIGLALSSTRAAAIPAALRFLFVSGLGSALALIGIAIIYAKTGSLNLAQLQQLAPTHLYDAAGLTAFALLLIGFGVKAELFPVNSWVPEVYGAVPGRVSALLAGLVSKLAVLVLVRILLQLFPLPEARELLLLFGLVGMVLGELAAWQARDYPRMLAFSSIGQLGVVFVAFSLPGTIGLMAGLAVALHHLVVKPGLSAQAEGWGRGLDGLRGVGRSAPLAAGLYLLLALSLVGLPPLPGFWSKLRVLSGLAAAAEPLHYLAMGALLAVTALEAVYLMRVGVRMYQADAGHASSVPISKRGTWLAACCVVALLAAALWIAPLGEWLGAVARELAASGRPTDPFLAGGAP